MTRNFPPVCDGERTIAEILATHPLLPGYRMREPGEEVGEDDVYQRPVFGMWCPCVGHPLSPESLKRVQYAARTKIQEHRR
jgi:hypothetical protein